MDGVTLKSSHGWHSRCVVLIQLGDDRFVRDYLLDTDELRK